jgi:hypothetical protein
LSLFRLFVKKVSTVQILICLYFEKNYSLQFLTLIFLSSLMCTGKTLNICKKKVEKDEKGKNFSLYTRIKWDVHSKCRVKSIIIVVGGKNFSKLFHYPTHMICNSKHDPLFCVFAKKKNIYRSLWTLLLQHIL